MVVLVIHEILKDGVAGKSVICHFEYVFAKIVHALKVAVIGMVVREGFENLYHLNTQFLVPSKRSSCVKMDDLAVLCYFWHLMDHPFVDYPCEWRIADDEVQLQS